MGRERRQETRQQGGRGSCAYTTHTPIAALAQQSTIGKVIWAQLVGCAWLACLRGAGHGRGAPLSSCNSHKGEREELAGGDRSCAAQVVHKR